jgi:hypothetical protein
MSDAGAGITGTQGADSGFAIVPLNVPGNPAGDLTWSIQAVGVAGGGTSFTVSMSLILEGFLVDELGRAASPVSFYAAKSANGQAGPFAGVQIGVWDAPDYNLGGGFNDVTGAFTAPVDGKYHFDLGVGFNTQVATNQIGMSIRKNGAKVAEQLMVANDSGENNPSLSVGVTLDLLAGDVVAGFAGTDNSGAFAGPGSAVTHFSGFLLGTGSADAIGTTLVYEAVTTAVATAPVAPSTGSHTFTFTNADIPGIADVVQFEVLVEVLNWADNDEPRFEFNDGVGWRAIRQQELNGAQGTNHELLLTIPNIEGDQLQVRLTHSSGSEQAQLTVTGVYKNVGVGGQVLLGSETVAWEFTAGTEQGAILTRNWPAGTKSIKISGKNTHGATIVQWGDALISDLDAAANTYSIDRAHSGINNVGPAGTDSTGGPVAAQPGFIGTPSVVPGPEGPIETDLRTMFMQPGATSYQLLYLRSVDPATSLLELGYRRGTLNSFGHATVEFWG